MKRNVLFVVILLLALCALACNVGSLVGSNDESPPAGPEEASELSETAGQDQQAASATGEKPGEASSPVDEGSSQAADSGGTGGDDEPAEEPAAMGTGAGIIASPTDALDSYRMRVEFQSGGEQDMLGMSRMEIEWVKELAAQHLTMFDLDGQWLMETIVIGGDTWTNMGDDSWMHMTTQSSATDVAGQPGQMTDLEGMLDDLQSSMELEGREVVNGVDCQRYRVDSDFSMPIPFPDTMDGGAAQFMPTEVFGHVTGTIWVADTSDLPRLVMRSETSEKLIYRYQERDDEEMSYESFRELYDLNEPIVIEPPEGAMEMPGIPAGSTTGQAGESVQAASLSELDTYRVSWKTSMTTGDETSMEAGYTMAVVNEPFASHMVSEIEFSPWGEMIQIGDQVWAKVGGNWIEGTEADFGASTDQIEATLEPDQDMVYVGDEVANGVSCRHYIFSIETAGTLLQQELWIADQAGMPPVPVRGLYRVVTGNATSETMADVYDINSPIVIKPPQ